VTVGKLVDGRGHEEILGRGFDLLEQLGKRKVGQ
jgi:hypothetical protein